jgi:hypothetical protein
MRLSFDGQLGADRNPRIRTHRYNPPIATANIADLDGSDATIT